jgi:hypothetical protein
MNTKSELTVDVEASIAKAYDTALSAKEQEQIRQHLSFVLPKLKEPNTFIEPVRSALLAMQSRPAPKPLYASAGAIVWTLVSALIIAGIVKLLGWN